MSEHDDPDSYLADEVIGLLVTMNARMSDHFARRAAEVDLTAAEGKVLLALAPGEAVSMRAVAGKLGYDPSNFTGVADKLEDRGLIVRRPHPNDRRVKAMAPTEQGRDRSERLARGLRTGPGPLSGLTTEQLRDLRTLLARATETCADYPGNRAT